MTVNYHTVVFVVLLLLRTFFHLIMLCADTAGVLLVFMFIGSTDSMANTGHSYFNIVLMVIS